MIRVALFVLFVSACGSSRPAPGPPALLKIACSVPTAELWLDGRFVAEVAEVPAGLLVTPGRHRLIVRDHQHHEAYLLFEVRPAEKKTLEIPLAPRFRVDK
jgi:hypothetical protein